MNDRQPVGIDRPVRALRHEVVHDPQETGGQEEADRVMAVPPLGQSILYAREKNVALGSGDRDRQGQVVHDVQHRDGYDKGQIEPVGHVDMRLLALPQGSQEDQEVNHPDKSQPQIGVPLRLGVFLGLRNAEDVARRGDHDEKLIAPEDEPGRDLSRQPRPAGSLHHIKGGRDQHVAAERENHRGGMNRPQAPEGGPGQIQVQIRKGKLQCDDQPDQESDDPPEGGGDDACFHNLFIVFDLGRVGGGQRGAVVVLMNQHEHAGDESQQKEQTMERHVGVCSFGRKHKAKQRADGKSNANDVGGRVYFSGMLGRIHRFPRVSNKKSTRGDKLRCRLWHKEVRDRFFLNRQARASIDINQDRPI